MIKTFFKKIDFYLHIYLFNISIEIVICLFNKRKIAPYTLDFYPN